MKITINSKFKNIYHFVRVVFLLTCIGLLLSGCTTFGVDNETWSTLSPQERQIAMQNYYHAQAKQQAEQAKIDQINAQNAPINDAISALSGAIGNKNKKCITDDFGQTVCGHSCYVDQFGNGHCAS